MDIRRTILWMIFSFSLLLLWNNWQVYQGQPSLFSLTPPAEQSKTAKSGDGKAAGQPAGVPTAAAPAQPGTPATVPGSAAEPQGRKVHLKTDVYDLTFDTTGAQLVQAQLLHYKSLDGDGGPMYLLNDQPGDTYVAQTGVVGAPQGSGYPTHLTPFSLVTPEPVAKGDSVEIAFEATAGQVKVVKTFIVPRNGYDIRVRHDITNLGDQPIDPSLYLQLTRDGNDPPNTSGFYSTFTGAAVYSSEDKFQKVKFDEIAKGKASYIQQADNGWIGIVQHYFASAWVPPQGTVRTNQALRLADNLYAIRTIEQVGAIAPGAQRSVEANLWVGPQDQQAMSAVAPGLELVVDYGWVTIIAKPMFKFMTWLHSLLGNWGWTIVVLTLLIKAVFYPLSAASYRSMAKMKLVAPRMQHLKEKFGDDKAKLNAAMMEMYRTEKINPLGGCLPMVVQIPVFIALYWVLLGSVEMRGAPWILWVHDLSVRDPWFILPAIMMATMFLQIKLNPTPPDPTQAKIMMIMPLVFGGMMFMFPAGLVLYWCVNNIVSIIQQRIIMVRLDREKAASASS
ncbi:membrane protein insertase YidC [Castellaniella defragrans]|uniref:Membrane protein insertase YidC n=2 Tax=Castellaniella defragrans TaxID=75697 RepID=W8X891_CASD6|nr:membrane protein insertase YidC [Castellaniella defragrans]KAB0622105.1 membrane protein insertase YidC [Castellaniella defragrans]MBB6085300.1 YidC/Oxa1 family membrane protein insertase [Castellaniella defragrans]CDM22665.1 Inner membrane protein translocase component YidC, long form [Castellaniella defragrans 65Phen]